MKGLQDILALFKKNNENIKIKKISPGSKEQH